MPLKSVSDIAKIWAAAGLSVVPIRPDGSKAPTIEWTEFQTRILTAEEIDRVFRPGLGIAIVGGEISGNLEFLDLDVPKDELSNPIHLLNELGERNPEPSTCIYEAWLDCLDPEMIDLVGTLPIVRTPGGGVHLYYRCVKIQGNQKLAMQVNPPGIKPALSTIGETRGRGGYVLVPGCPPECHPTGKTYEFISGSFDSGAGVPTISDEQRSRLLTSVRSFDQSGLLERFKKPKPSNTTTKAHGLRPGDDYNLRARWEDILEPNGWTFAYVRGYDGAVCWRRPGKPAREKGISATVRNMDGMELFHSFSSNCDPLPFEKSVTKFCAYTLFYHNGDYEASARELGKLGYGDQRKPKDAVDIDSIIDGRRDDSVPWGDCEFDGSIARIDDLDDEQFYEADADAAPFNESAAPPLDASLFYEAMDPLDVQLFEDEEQLAREERQRRTNEEVERRRELAGRGPAHLVWRDFGDPPARELTSSGRIKTSVDCPRDTTWIIINDHFCNEGLRTVHYQNEFFMLWNGMHYRTLKFTEMKSHLSRHLSHFAESTKGEDGEVVYVPFKVRQHKANEMVGTLQDMTYLESDIGDPCWLGAAYGDTALPDPREVVCCKNGLLDIATRTLLPPTPAFYTFNNTEIDYDPAAPIPKTWLSFLDSSLDKESQQLLQEWFGYCLVQDTRLQKMLMVVGSPGSGKGTAMSVLQSLVGESSRCAMSFETINKQFGLQNALGKSLMIFPDARQDAKFDNQGSIVGTLLSITGEDEIQVDRKNLFSVTTKLNTRVVIVSNEVMRLTDRAKALSRRILWLKFPGHNSKTDPDLKRKLNAELSGILNWAIEGWAMVRKTGEFTSPSSAHMLKDSFEEQSSDISSFIEDMCVVGPEESAEKVSLVHHWNAWRISKGYKKMGEAQFGKLLSAAVMRLETERRRAGGGGRKWFYTGVGLSSEKVVEYAQEYGGEDMWRDIIKSMGSRGGHGDGDTVSIAEYLEKQKDRKTYDR